MNLFIICCTLILLSLFIFLSSVWHRKDNTHIVLPSCTIVLTVFLYLYTGSDSENAMRIVTSSNDAKLAENIINNNKSFSNNSIDAMIINLEKRLLNEKDDLNGWILLARSHFDKKNYKKAIFAYEQTLNLSPNQPDLMADLANVLTIENDGYMNDRTIELLKKSILIDPEHQKTLVLLATSAMKRSNENEAIFYWSQLKSTLEKDSGDTKKIEQIIQSLLASTNNNNDLPSELTEQKIITGEVFLSNEALGYFEANPISSKAVIFIIAKDPNGNPMPVAVSKIELASFKETLLKEKRISFVISDSNSMVRGRNLSQFETLQLQAKLSYQGLVTPKKGDLFSDEILVEKNIKKINLKLSRVR